MELPFGKFGLNVMTKCLTLNNGMSPSLNTALDDLIVYTMSAWERLVKFVKTSAYLAKALLRGFDQTWGVRTFSIV